MSNISRTPSRSPAPPLNTALPPMPDEPPTAVSATTTTPGTPRRSSFSFLRRGKSIERLNSKRSTSGSKKLTKRGTKEQENNTQEVVPMQPPKIPDIASQPTIQSFGGETARDSFAHVADKAVSSRSGGGKYSNGKYTSTRAEGRGVPIPPVPDSSYVDPYARTESMTNRGRYSYASSAISSVTGPRRVRRRKDPTPFNVLVVGASNSGKSSFFDFLRTSLTLPARKQRQVRDDFAPESGPSKFNPAFVSQYLETELGDGERVGLTLWDSEGLEQNMIDIQLRQIVGFIESRFEETFAEEVKIVRSPGARDTHIHCVFLILDPLRLDKTMASKVGKATTNGNINDISFMSPPSPDPTSMLGGEDLDIRVLRALQGKTTVIPVVSKADTITVDHMDVLKMAVWTSLKESGLDHLENLGLDATEESDDSEDDDSFIVPGKKGSDTNLLHPESAVDPDDRSMHSRLDLTSSSEASSVVIPSSKKSKPVSNTSPYLPLSILSPSPIIPHEPGIGKVGRRFPWGFADPYDPNHCDFVKLRDLVFGEWRSELREASKEIWYEQWRTTRLHKSSTVSPKSSNLRSKIHPIRENVPPSGSRSKVSVAPAMAGYATSGPLSAPNQAPSWPLPAR